MSRKFTTGMVDNVKVIECALIIATQSALVSLSRGETYQTALKVGSSGNLFMKIYDEKVVHSAKKFLRKNLSRIKNKKK